MEDTTESQWDMSFRTFGRIDYELWHANTSRRKEDMQGWWKSLENLYIEVETYLDKKDREDCEKKYAECYALYVSYMNHENSTRNNPRAQTNARPNVHSKWFSWEKRLRQLLDKHKMLLRKAEGPGGAFV